MRFLSSVIAVVACLFLSVSSAYAQTYSGPIILAGSTCSNPGGMAVNSATGDVYASCFNTNNVLLFPGGVYGQQNPTSLAGTCHSVEGLTYTSCYGYLYAACWGDNSIDVWSQGGQGGYAQLAGALNRPHSVVVSPLDTIYASTDDGVNKYPLGGKAGYTIALGGCTYGRQIATHPVTGDVFLACYGDSNVLRYVGGSSSTNVLASCAQAYGVQVSLNGDVFAACPGDSTVIHIPYNNITSSWGPAVILGGTCQSVYLVWKENVGLFASCSGQNAVKLYTPSVIASGGSPILVGTCNASGSLAVTDDGRTVYCAEESNNDIVAFVQN